MDIDWQSKLGLRAIGCIWLRCFSKLFDFKLSLLCTQDTFDIRILMAKSVKHTVNFLEAKEEDLYRFVDATGEWRGLIKSPSTMH